MLRFKISKQDIAKFEKQVLTEWQDKCLATLTEVCDKAINLQWVKFRPEGYNDITGNLRSSTGYIIYYDGKVLHEKFELSSYGTDRETGLKIGRNIAFAELRKSKGWGILFVAGMEYASWVQINGFSVLVHANSVIEKDLEKELREICLG